MNLLEIGKIVRVHGVRGAVKVTSYIDEDFSHFKHVYVGKKKLSANILRSQTLNNEAYVVSFDIMPNIDSAEMFKNQSVYIDREEYSNFKDKLYLSDLVNKLVMSETGEKLGSMVDYDDYGASVILSINSDGVNYQIPYVDEIIKFDREKDAFVVDKQKFEDMRV